MKIVFRADSSIDIGSGHIMRCLTLATYLAEKGHQCHFICRNHQGNIIDVIVQKGFSVHILSEVQELIAENKKLFHSHWLGVSQQKDAEESISLLQSNNIEPDWLVVDHYALDEEWQILLNQKYPATKILVIDDLGDRNHRCDLLLDQNLDASSEKYFSRVIPTRTQVLTGVEYALLRPEFAKWREKSLERRANPKFNEILLNLGGIDKDNITGQILNELNKADLPEGLHITVVMGKTAPHIELVQKIAKQSRLKIDVVVNASNMAELMTNADLAIGAAGSTSWERCCLGLPTLLLVLAENQKKVAEILDNNNMAKIVYVTNIAKVLEKMTACNLREMSEKARLLIDGLGILRVVNKMEQVV